MHRHGLARGQHHVGEEALVAFHQRGGEERGGKRIEQFPEKVDTGFPQKMRPPNDAAQPRFTPIAESDSNPPSIVTALPLI